MKPLKDGKKNVYRLTPGNVLRSCRAFWALIALSRPQQVRKAQPRRDDEGSKRKRKIYILLDNQ